MATLWNSLFHIHFTFVSYLFPRPQSAGVSFQSSSPKVSGAAFRAVGCWDGHKCAPGGPRARANREAEHGDNREGPQKGHCVFVSLLFYRFLGIFYFFVCSCYVSFFFVLGLSFIFYIMFFVRCFFFFFFKINPANHDFMQTCEI